MLNTLISLLKSYPVFLPRPDPAATYLKGLNRMAIQNYERSAHGGRAHQLKTTYNNLKQLTSPYVP